MRKFVAALALLLALPLVACEQTAQDTATVNATDGTEDAPVERASLEEGEPYPYTYPAPPEEETPIDGTYTRSISVRQAGGVPIYCRRCAPWRVDAGDSELRLTQGRLYATFETIPMEKACPECSLPPGFSATAHYQVQGDTIEIYNDPNCVEEVGRYRWTLSDGELTFEEIEDTCPFVRLRAKYFMAAPWEASGST